jgi:hypothetical protein
MEEAEFVEKIIVPHSRADRWKTKAKASPEAHKIGLVMFGVTTSDAAVRYLVER